MELLKKLLGEGEGIYEIRRLSDYSIYVIGEEGLSPRNLNIAACIEDTLHRLLEAEAGDEVIHEILGASKDGYYDDDDGYYIDLDYSIKSDDFMDVLPTGIIYERPCSKYIASRKSSRFGKKMYIPDDAGDDEILDLMKEKFDINPEEYIIEDLDDGLYGVQSLYDSNDIFIIKKAA